MYNGSSVLQYIKDRKPIYSWDKHMDVYEYDDESDLVYDRDGDFYFVKRSNRHISNPLYRKWHRIDGPGYIYCEEYDWYWYLNDKEYTFEEWLKLTPLSSQEKVKLRLKYGQ